MKSLPVLVLALIVALPLAFGANEVVVKTLSVVPNIEPGDTATYELIITNTQDERDIFTISYDEFAVFPFSDYVKVIRLSPSQIKLDPQQSGKVNVSIKTSPNVPIEKSFFTSIKISSLLKPSVGTAVELKTYIQSPKDTLVITPSLPPFFQPGEEVKLKLSLENKAKYFLDTIQIEINSEIDALDTTLIHDFLPKEEIVEEVPFTIPSRTKAGEYTLEITAYDKEAVVGVYKSSIIVSEKALVGEKREKSYGFLSSTTTITKFNDGNYPSEQRIQLRLNFFKDFFAALSPLPLEEEGNYVWETVLDPGESFAVTLYANYRPLFYGIIAIVLALLILLRFSESMVVLQKAVTKVIPRHDGTMDVKIMLFVRNGKKSQLQSATVLDVLPHPFEPTGDYGSLRPEKVQKGQTTHRMIWHLGNIESKEERIISYRARCRMELLGSAMLPAGTLQYVEANGNLVTLRSGQPLVGKHASHPAEM